MSNVYLIFLIVAAPVLFFMLTWTIVSAYRLLFPEKPLPLDQDPVIIRQQATARGAQVPVGIREIREDQRLQRSARPAATTYVYTPGMSDGVPAGWKEDLWRRRN